MTLATTKYGTVYEHPRGVEAEKYYELMYEFIDLAKSKGLTVRQAQKLFVDCSDMVLETHMYDNEDANNELKSIADSLSQIANTGIDIFSKAYSTKYDRL